MKEYSNGQVLAEVIVTIGVIVLLVTGLIVGATGTLKANQYSSRRNLAVKYAQESIETVRTIRDNSWETFQTYGDAMGKSWCLGKTGTWAPMSGSCPYDIDTYFSRNVTFTWHDDPLITNDERMQVDVVVSWTDGVKIYEVPLTTYLTQWR